METAPGGPVQSTAQIETALLDALHTIRTHWAALLTPGGSSSIAGGNVGRSNDEVTALDRKVSLSHEVTLCLNGWARIIVEDRPLTFGLEGVDPLKNWERISDTHGLIKILETHARWFSGHEAAQTATDELAGWAGKVQAAAAPKAREWIYLGDCPFIVEDWFCSGQVRYPRASEEDDPHAFCSDCGQIGVASWWEQVITGKSLEEIPRDELPALIYRTFGRHVSRPTLHRWIKTGELARLDYVRVPEWFDRAQVIDAVSLRWIAC